MTSPSQVPSQLTAGDTIAWTRTLPDYPAGTWTLKYRFVNSAGKVDITAGSSGTDHAVSVAAATSASWAAGKYRFQEWVENGAVRYTISEGIAEILPNLAALNTYETRTEARQILDGLRAAYKTYATGGQGNVAEYEIAGRRMKFKSSAEIIEAINYWQAEVVREEQADKLARGIGIGAKILVRMQN